MPAKNTAMRNAGNLIIGDGSVRITVNEESNFFRGQLFAVPLAVNQVDSSH
jgi:TPP-dependent 2-oxoacid decarboxylase